MNDIGTIIEIAEQIMPKKIFKNFLKELSMSKTVEASPAGATLVGVYILEYVRFAEYVDQVLGEEHTSIAQLRHSFHNRDVNGECMAPSSGIILSLMVADMVARPRNITPMYKFEEAAVLWRTGPLLGIDPSYLNDDRIGRVMSAIGSNTGNLEEILYSMIMEAGKKAGISLNRFILDTTTLELDGKFKDAPKVTTGRGRNSFSQLIVSLCVAAGSRMPVGFDVLAGNTSDAATLPDAIRKIDRVADDGAIEVLMDRIYATPTNVLFFKEHEKERMVYWISPLKTGLSKDKVREKIDEANLKKKWEPVGYRSDKEIKANLPPPLTAFETIWILTEEIKPELEPGQKRRPKGSVKTVEMEVRCVFYRHENNAVRDREDRERRKGQLDESMQKMQGLLNKWDYKSIDFCKKKLSKLLSSVTYTDIKGYLKYDLSQMGDGVITLEWSWDYDGLDKESDYDGIFALLTNYEEQQVSKNKLVVKYRGRDEVEVDFKAMKGILDLERILFQRPERIDTYVFVKVVAFFVLTFMRCYAEREGIKTTERKIQEGIGDLLLVENQILPLGIKCYGIARDTELNQLFRKLFSLPDPYELIEILEDEEKANIEKYIHMWYDSQ